ncbi:aldo/keto reductase [Microbacterium sp. SORGH_AS_0888]|uniref:aldo/keto reductase n=1 Tax=Microbacterium sp. SORGH_AS_0888 TaxID=3041791 RepID=UPI0027822163|nr:aldo/keto reductase [Microbacterium sp. SORGH_AS_0888]MDQ1129210.1 aryl-alcohol dehydrogenase-like predicted oxidoreductase [Microbacterium sp. SORGH_AS_0888]
MSRIPTVSLGDDLAVSALGYGGMSLSDVYGPVDDETALSTLVHAVDAGLTFVDTANIYGAGRSERIISRLLAHRRDEIVLATKFGIAGGAIGARTIRGDAAYVREQIDLSLGRLGTDHVDLYYQHRVDPTVPIEETVGAMAELVAAGKVRHLGLSECTADELRRANAVHPIAAVQTEWSIVSRDVEAGVVPAAIELGVGFVPYSPLSRAWLTDGFSPAQIGEGDGRPRFPRFAPETLAANAALRTEVLAIAAEAGLTGAQLALSWLFTRAADLGIPIAPIPGSRFAAHVDEWLPAVDARLSAETMARLETVAGRIRGDRSFDRGWTSQRGEAA